MLKSCEIYAVRIRLQLVAFICSVAFIASACSFQGTYDAFQYNNRLACQGLPPSDYEECLEGSDMQYEEYQRQREKLQKSSVD
ncbi:hypothetical protein DFR28_1021172 [Arenicella xantha]|uniref:Lipoprotein n=1 Tax=Arenicella xantha TaxID=644221 RepID=A0A395JMA3_9GAMM|nr:hypothetical protein DFR28_1021172 [Arenicella xantha]